MKHQRTSPLSEDELLSKMEHYCAYRERCPKEVHTKLAELGAKGDIAAQIFHLLKAENFFDEERFAMAYAGGKFRNNNWGKVRIRLELQMRSISPETIQQALESIEMDAYEALLIKLLQKKLQQYTDSGNAREKAAASLIRMGFEPELVFKYLQKNR